MTVPSSPWSVRVSCGGCAGTSQSGGGQTDFSNAEAVGYLADRLNRIGIEDRLLELGALPGDGVAIGGANAVIFDFAPQIDIGAEILNPRGQDHRLAEERPAAERRREKDRAYHAPDDQEDAPDLDPVDGFSGSGDRSGRREAGLGR